MKPTKLSEAIKLAKFYFEKSWTGSALGEPQKRIGSNIFFEPSDGIFTAVKFIVHDSHIDQVSATLIKPVSIQEIECTFGRNLVLLRNYKDGLDIAEVGDSHFIYRFLLPNGDYQNLNENITEFILMKDVNSSPKVI